MATNVKANTIREPVVLGKIIGHFGVRGWLKVRSYTRPIEQLFEYENLLAKADNQDLWVGIKILNFRYSGNGFVVKFDHGSCRDDVESLIGSEIGIEPFELATLPAGEYYWKDLVGLCVTNMNRVELGEVVNMLETGANDVLIVKSDSNLGDSVERLIPWIPSVIRCVDLKNRTISVDWDESY